MDQDVKQMLENLRLDDTIPKHLTAWRQPVGVPLQTIKRELPEDDYLAEENMGAENDIKKVRFEKDDFLSENANYWLTESSNHDCFFIVGREYGMKERIGAIRIFLLGYSEPFRAMLGQGSMRRRGDIDLEDVEPETFKSFLKCCYGGCDDVIKKLNFQQSMDLLIFCDTYAVTSFKNKIGNHMAKQVMKPLHNFFIGVSSPISFRSDNLGNALSDTFLKNTKEILAHKMFLQLSSDGLLYIVKNFTASSEVDLWEAVLKWAEHRTHSLDGKSLRDAIEDHLNYMSFESMTYLELCTKVFPTNILESDEIADICRSINANNDPNPKTVHSVSPLKKI